MTKEEQIERYNMIIEKYTPKMDSHCPLTKTIAFYEIEFAKKELKKLCEEYHTKNP